MSTSPGGTTTHRAAERQPGQARTPPSYDPASPAQPPRRTSRRAGYVAAAVVNAVFLWMVNQLLDWGWPPVLTDDLEDLLPYVDVSLAATIAVNLVWAWRDPFWFRHAGQIALDVVSLVVAMRTWQLFPFDFTGYWSGWETVARVLIVVAIVGILVDIVVRAVALATGPRRSADLV